jgi:ADP-heptose:LPS heptosyltransferase
VGVSLLPGVRRLAVLRASALGDFVFALPALAALRTAYPSAEIVLLARTWHRDFLAGRPSPVDHVVPLPEGFVGDEGVPFDPAARDRILGDLRRERFDLAIQMHGGGRNSNPIVRALGARSTAGAATPDAPSLDRTIPYVYWQHELVRCLETVHLVGAEPTTMQPEVPVTDDDLERSRRVVPDTSRPIAVLHPGATDARRRWPADRFADVGAALADGGLQVVVTGTDDERHLTSSIAERGRALDLAGRLDLAGLAGLLARAEIVVSNDTGPLHLADAVGTRTVGIFWAGNVINAAPPFRNRHRPMLSWRLECPVCGASTLAERCGHDASFVDGVSVADVLDAVRSLLGSPLRTATSAA